MEITRRTMETYYLIDYENVHEDGLKGIDKLTEKDHVCLMYTPNASKISLDILAGIKSDFKVIKAAAGKQSLDMHIATFMGFLVGANVEKKADYVIISKDTDFDSILRFWNSGEVGSFSRRPAIEWNPDEEEEKQAKAQPKKSTAAKKRENVKTRDNKGRKRRSSYESAAAEPALAPSASLTEDNKPETTAEPSEKVSEPEMPVMPETLGGITATAEEVMEAADTFVPVTEEKESEAAAVSEEKTAEPAAVASEEEKAEPDGEPEAREKEPEAKEESEAKGEPEAREKESEAKEESETNGEPEAQEKKPEAFGEAVPFEQKPEAEETAAAEEKVAGVSGTPVTEEISENVSGEETLGNRTQRKKKKGPGRPKGSKNAVKTKALPEEARTEDPAPKPVSDKTQLNNHLIRVLRDAQVESTTAQQVASIVVSNMDKKNIKQLSYREIIKKFGQKPGLEYYGLIKKEI